MGDRCHNPASLSDRSRTKQRDEPSSSIRAGWHHNLALDRCCHDSIAEGEKRNGASASGCLLLLSLPILYGVAPYYLERSLSFTHDGAIPSNPPDIGFWFLLLTFIAIWLTDTGAYLVGRSLGKRKLAPTISPNKSIEGAVGGLFFAVTATLLLGDLILPELDVIDLMIGAVAGVVGQLGDLVESHLKRATGVKDSSAIIPGHGGVLDRFDSLILVAPTLLGYLVVRVAIERLFS